MKVFKYNEDLGKMIEVGTLLNSDELIFNLPKPLEGYDVSLYNRKFFILKSSVDTRDNDNWTVVIPKNVTQITTGSEGINYTLGHIENGIVIFYDQYL